MNQSYRYDYSKTMWMKMFLAKPDFPNNRSYVYINFEQALELIKTMDILTQGLQKIVYLVGWQGLGHDDNYPDMTEVNDFLKRDCDESGRESLLWLIKEAKKYHTVVSFHGNVADAYEASPSFAELTAAHAVCMGQDGTPLPLDVYNERDTYKTSFRQYWESGIFKKYFDRFCDLVPVREVQTLHLDAFGITENQNPVTGVEEQDEARNKILDYIASLGIDVTTEFTYRELPHNDDAGKENRSFTEAPVRMLGRVAAAWWMNNLTPDEYVKYSPSLFTGHPMDPKMGDVFYGSMHGEDIWQRCGRDNEKWVPEFVREFCTYQLPYFYLNRFTRLSCEEQEDGSFIGRFSDGVVSSGASRTITRNGIAVKCGDDVLLPLDEKNDRFIAYSASGKSGEWAIPDASDGPARLYEIAACGNRFLGETNISSGSVILSVKAGQALLIKCERKTQNER